MAPSRSTRKAARSIPAATCSFPAARSAAGPRSSNGAARAACSIGSSPANAYDDDGWADHNPSKVRQYFGKLGWQNETSDLDVSFTGADNTLQGTQTLPLSFLDDIKQAYTFPDENQNKLAFLTTKGSHFLRDDVLLGGNLYYRNYKTRNVSSNVNDEFEDDDDIQATNDASDIDQDSYGGGLQLVITSERGGRKNQLTLGATGRHCAGALQSVLAGGAVHRRARHRRDSTTSSSKPMRIRAVATIGAFIADTFNLSPEWTLTASGRYNQARIRIEDRTGEAPLSMASTRSRDSIRRWASTSIRTRTSRPTRATTKACARRPRSS